MFNGTVAIEQVIDGKKGEGCRMMNWSIETASSTFTGAVAYDSVLGWERFYGNASDSLISYTQVTSNFLNLVSSSEQQL